MEGQRKSGSKIKFYHSKIGEQNQWVGRRHGLNRSKLITWRGRRGTMEDEDGVGSIGRFFYVFWFLLLLYSSAANELKVVARLV